MALTISAADLQLISGLDHAVVLGIILQGGTVGLRVADPDSLRGHADWLRREPMLGVRGGFSLIIKEGLVTHLFAMSVLNPGPHPALEDALIRELEELIPLADEFRIIRY